MKGVSIVIGTLIMVMIVIALGSATLVYINSVIIVKEQGIEVESASCNANPVLRTDVNVDGWVDLNDADEVFNNECNPSGGPPPVCTSEQLEKYDVKEPTDGKVDGDDWTRVALDNGKLSGGHAFVKITNIGTGPINTTSINIERTLPTSGPVTRIEWGVANLILIPRNTTTAEFICPGGEGASCEYKVSPPTGKSDTAIVYCI